MVQLWERGKKVQLFLDGANNLIKNKKDLGETVQGILKVL